MIVAAAALALWSGLLQPWRSEAHTERYKPAQGWVLEVRRDTFTNTTTCQIKARDMTYRHGVLTFRFPTRVDTANAFYRIDQGSAQSVGLVATEAAGLGAEFRSQNMKNPSNGRVHIPATYLQTAQTVSIRPNAKRPAKTFSLTGFDKAVSVAKDQGCDLI